MALQKIAVVGAGLIGRRHIGLVTQEPTCELAAIADPTPNARDTASKANVPYFADHREMLDKIKPDGVIIATPNPLHAPVALDCVAAGIPALIEKPVSDKVESAEELDRIATAAGVPLLVGHHRRHNPIIGLAHRAVRDGVVGQLTAIAGFFLIRKADDYYTDGPWRKEPGGGPILNNLTHDIDSLRYICGEPVSIQAAMSSAARGFKVEDSAAIIMRFQNGALGTFTLSDAVPAPWSWELTTDENPVYPHQDNDCYLLCGTVGSLAIPTMTLFSYSCPKQGWWDPLAARRLAYEAADPLVLQLQHFLAVAAGKAEPLVPVRDAIRTVAVVDAIQRAAETGETINL